MANELRKWKLQLFAEEGAGSGDNGAGDDSSGQGAGTGDDGKGASGDDGKGSDGSGDDGKKYSDDEVNKIVEKKFAKWKAQHEEDLKNAKAEAEKLAKMNAEQKKDYELEKIKAENEKLKAEAARYELGKEAVSILKEHKIDATQDILDFVVGDDAESTKANIDKFVEIIDSQLKLAEKERATGKTPPGFGSGGENTSEIMKRIEKYK